MASTVWRGYISFGLISIPVRLFRAARAERISLRRLYAGKSAGRGVREDEDESFSEAPVSKATKPSAPAVADSVENRTDLVLTPLKQVSARAENGEVVPAGSIVKGYEYEKDRFVSLDAEELKSAAAKTSSAMEIEAFVPLAAIDPVYFETSYYLIPEEAGEKAYALLYRSMLQTGLVALAQFAMHSREHVVVLRPGKKGMLAHTMFFASEVRADEEFDAAIGDVSKKELELAQTLIRSLEAPFEPEKYRDSYQEKIQALIDRKVKGLPIEAEPALPRQAEVVDIADALRRSLANLKKPAASAGLGKEEVTGAAKASKTAKRGAGQR